MSSWYRCNTLFYLVSFIDNTVTLNHVNDTRTKKDKGKRVVCLPPPLLLGDFLLFIFSERSIIKASTGSEWTGGIVFDKLVVKAFCWLTLVASSNWSSSISHFVDTFNSSCCEIASTASYNILDDVAWLSSTVFISIKMKNVTILNNHIF